MFDFSDFLDLFGLGGDNEDESEFGTGGGEPGEGALEFECPTLVKLERDL